MNFYIRFLQQQVSSANQISVDCHFFNTYFYKKLSDAVSYKGNDKDAFLSSSGGGGRVLISSVRLIFLYQFMKISIGV